LVTGARATLKLVLKKEGSFFEVTVSKASALLFNVFLR
jgi:hypothetical protein